MAMLTDDEARHLALLASITSDAESKKRIAEIQAATEEHNKTLANVQVQQQVIEQSRRDAQSRLDAAVAKEAENERLKSVLDERERQMGEVNKELNAEKQRFQKVREEVDRQQKEAAAALETGESALASRTRDIDRRDEAVKAVEADYRQKTERLSRVLEALARPLDELQSIAAS